MSDDIKKRDITSLIEKEAPNLHNLLDPQDVNIFNEMTGESSWELVNLPIIEEGEEKEEGNDLVVEMESNPMSAAREIEMTSDSRIEKKRKMKGKRTRWSITGRV